MARVAAKWAGRRKETAENVESKSNTRSHSFVGKPIVEEGTGKSKSTLRRRDHAGRSTKVKGKDT
jgi:hypothetical protein